MEGDGKYNIIWKLVEQEGGTPAQGDSIRDLLAKYLTAIGGTPVQGDLFMNLLRKVVIIKGGTPLPGDHEWDLLVKWLQAEGICRKCGDSVHDLWKKILALADTCGLQPDQVILSQASPGDPLSVSVVPATGIGTQWTIARSINGGAFSDVATEEDGNFPYEGADAGLVEGDSVRVAVRRQGSDAACQVISNTITYHA